MRLNQENKMLRRLTQMATAKRYTVRDAQTLLEIEGYYRPSLDFIWKFFRRSRRAKISGKVA